MDRRVAEVFRLLETNDLHLTRKHPLEELAKSVNLSPSRLRHVFKSETGFSPAQFFTAWKLNKAKRLLETSHCSVKEVAAAVGMSNGRYFIRAFKGTYGVTPGYYRSHFMMRGGTVFSQPPLTNVASLAAFWSLQGAQDHASLGS